MRYGMVIDLKKCIGCRGCSLSCKAENGTPKDMFWNDVVQEEFGKYPNVTKVYLPRPCMHCAEPECLRVCPTGATYKEENNGKVMIDHDKCMGCRYCIVACPYEARYYLSELTGYFGKELTPYEKMHYKHFKKGVVYKCDFCGHRLEKGQEPACVANCMGKARYFGDLDDPDSEVSQLIKRKHGFQLHPEKGTNPSVYYLAP